MQTIQSGTKLNTELLKKENDIGTIEVGKFADIIEGIGGTALP